jgi:hypothetical protein
MTRAPKHHRPGIYPDLSFDDYAAIPAVNRTLLGRLRHGGRAAWHYRRYGTVVTDAMKAGSLAHIQVLDPRAYLDRVVEWREPVLLPLPALDWQKLTPEHYRTTCGCYELEKATGVWRVAVQGALLPILPGTVTAAKAAAKAHYERTTERQPKLDAEGRPVLSPQNPNSRAYQDFLARNPGRTVVTRKELEQAERIARAVRDNPDANEALSGIWDTEVSIVWKDPDTGVLCKGRIDWLTDPARDRVLIGDLKTCRDNAPPWFPKDAARREYYAQMAWYRMGLTALSAKGPEIHCVLLAVQSGGCHDSTVYDLDDDELRAGDELNAERLQQLLELEEGYGERPWPGKCQRAPLNLAEHAPGVLGEGGELDLDGLEDE